MLYGTGHDELADTIEMSKAYSPDEMVKVKRVTRADGNEEPRSSDETTERTEYVPAN